MPQSKKKPDRYFAFFTSIGTATAIGLEGEAPSYSTFKENLHKNNGISKDTHVTVYGMHEFTQAEFMGFFGVNENLLKSKLAKLKAKSPAKPPAKKTRGVKQKNTKPQGATIKSPEPAPDPAKKAPAKKKMRKASTKKKTD